MTVRPPRGTSGGDVESAHEVVPRPALDWMFRSLEVFALTGFVVLFYLVPEGATTWVLAVNLATFYLLLGRAIIRPDRIQPWLPSHITIEVLFLGFSYLIFYHQYQLAVLGAGDLRRSVYVVNTFADGSNQAITLATVGMLAFTLGFRSPRPAAYTGPTRSAEAERRFFGGMATAASTLLLGLAAMYLLAGWRSAGEGRYTGTTSEGTGVEGISSAIMMLCMMVAALWVYAKAARLRTPVTLTIGLLAALAWTVRLLVFGDRGAFMLFALVLAGGYFTFVRRASRVLLVIALTAWMFIYRSMEVLRLTPDWYRSGNIWDLIFNSPYARQTSGESSFNVTTIGLRATVEVFPELQNYTYGVLKLMQFTTIIPFSGAFYLPYLDPDYTSSAIMLGDIMLPASADYEPGTNVISDSYIDFGVAGVVLLLFAIGWFAKMMRNSVARDPGDPLRIVMYLLTMAMFAELPRYAIEVPARTLAWAFIFSVGVGLVTHRFDKADPVRTGTLTVSSVAGYSRSRS
jgi:oligosaccharide repeat unit polymerase